LRIKPVLLVVLLSLVSFFSFAPLVHASGSPTVVKTVSEVTCGTNYFCNSKMTGATPGDLFVADVTNDVSGTGSTHHNFYFSIGSSTANITNAQIAVQNYVLQCDYNSGMPTCNFPANNAYFGSAVIYGIIATNVPDLVVQTNQTSIDVANHLAITSYDVSGVSPTQLSYTGTGSIGGTNQNLKLPSATNMVSSVYGGANNFYTGAYFTSVVGISYSFSLPSGFTDYGSAWGPEIQMLGATSGVSSPTTMPIVVTATHTVNQTVYTYAAAAFGPAYAAVVVVPCTFTQLQCWWYPMLFMLAFSGVFLMVAGVSKTPPKQAMFLFLCGLSFGSVVAVIFGLLTIIVPLALLVLNVLYVVRFRGR
jgi:hypothetical protein